MDIINLLQNDPYTLFIGAGILGLMIGSFLNVVIYRLPITLKNECEQECRDYLQQPPLTPQPERFNLAFPRSCCPKCLAPILWWQNIPVISYMILRGRCSTCHERISLLYPLVEILTAIATILVVIHFGVQAKTLPLLLLTWALIAASFIDLKQQLLPDNITIPLVWLGLLLNTNHLFTSPSDAIIGAIGGYLFLWTIAKTFKLLRKVEGMGYGDFKLLAVFGAWLGWQILPLVIVLSSLAALVVGVFLVLNKQCKLNQPFPFGPYIACAGWLACFFGQPIISCIANTYFEKELCYEYA